MGQLIKIQDYISRYEQDIYKYPSRFVRLKKQQWDLLKYYWDTGWNVVNEDEETFEEENKNGFIHKVKKIFRKKQAEENSETMVEVKDDEHTIISDILSLHKPSTLDDLKKQFLNKIFEYQMIWASSTLIERSIVDPNYRRNENLKYFLQRFPDTFLIMFNPVFLLKKAPVEMDHIIITPTGIICLSFLEDETDAVFIGSDDRFWTRRFKGEDKKIVNPVISLNRTGKIVEQLIKLHEIDLPMEKVLLSRNGYIDFPHISYNLRVIDKRNYDQWFQQKRTFKSPIKHLQLKAAQVLLQYCDTNSIKRFD